MTANDVLLPSQTDLEKVAGVVPVMLGVVLTVATTSVLEAEVHPLAVASTQ